MKMNRIHLLLCAALPLTASTFAAEIAREKRTVEGWTVLVNERLLKEDKEGTEKGIEILRAQLQEVARLVPAPAVARLREVTLYLSPEYPGVRPTAEYHPGAGWLRDHGRDPAMEKGIEFTDVRNFESEAKRIDRKSTRLNSSHRT